MEETEQDSENQCRICYDGPDAGSLISPCICTGSQKYVHFTCLSRWQETQVRRIAQTGSTNFAQAESCELCKARYSAEFLRRRPVSRQQRIKGFAIFFLRRIWPMLIFSFIMSNLAYTLWPETLDWFFDFATLYHISPTISELQPGRILTPTFSDTSSPQIVLGLNDGTDHIGYILEPIGDTKHMYGGQDRAEHISVWHTTPGIGGEELVPGIFIGGDLESVGEYRLVKGEIRWGKYQLESEIHYREIWALGDIATRDYLEDRLFSNKI